MRPCGTPNGVERGADLIGDLAAMRHGDGGAIAFRRGVKGCDEDEADGFAAAGRRDVEHPRIFAEGDQRIAATSRS